MAIYTLARTETAQMPLAECWAFFSNPRNLERITPPSLRFRVDSEAPTEIYAGLIIRYTVSPLWHIPMTWVSEITQVRAPQYFVDEQRTGPYRLWHHEHFLRAIDERQTEVRDLVHYAPPLGLLGAIVNKLVIRAQLERIFDFRSEQLRRMAAGK